MKKDIEKLYFHRLRNLRIIVKLLRLAPFVRCVILNGSMANGKIKPSSDIDILIIAKSGRIYTCRAAVLFWASLTGLKRSSNQRKTHAGRFCFNYFLSEGFLTIPHDRGCEVDKYCAENYSKSILLSGDRKIFNKYMRTNWMWMRKYVYKIPNSKFQIPNKFPASPAGGQNPNSKMSNGMQRIVEKIVSKRFGDWLEKKLKAVQVARIEKDPAVKKYSEYIVFNDRELRFHHPKTKKYENIIQKLP